MSNEIADETEYGFTWGEVNGLVWLRNDEGDYKKVHPDLLEHLRRSAQGDESLEVDEEPLQRAIDELREEGYLEEGGEIVEESAPEDIWLAPRLVAFVAAFALLAAVTYARWDIAWPPPRDPWINLVALPFFVVAAICHEFGHYTAAKPYFNPSIRVGLLNSIFPAFITETTGAWRCPKSIRIWITLAGPFVDIWLTLVLAVAHLYYFPDFDLFSTLILVQFFRIIFVFNPLIEGDGYWLLSDTFEVVNLRTRGWKDLKSLRVTGRSAYIVVSAVFLTLAVSLGVYILTHMFLFW